MMECLPVFCPNGPMLYATWRERGQVMNLRTDDAREIMLFFRFPGARPPRIEVNQAGKHPSDPCQMTPRLPLV